MSFCLRPEAAACYCQRLDISLGVLIAATKAFTIKWMPVHSAYLMVQGRVSQRVTQPCADWHGSETSGSQLIQATSIWTPPTDPKPSCAMSARPPVPSADAAGNGLYASIAGPLRYSFSRAACGDGSKQERFLRRQAIVRGRFGELMTFVSGLRH